MRMAMRQPRRGFSLLEMVLALAIGMMLLLALYLSFSIYIGSAQAGRNAVAESTLARNVLNRVGMDIMSQVGPDDNRVNDYPPPQGEVPDSERPPMVKYNHGIQYQDDKVLYLSNYRVRKPAATKPNEDAKSMYASDLRLTVYWLVRSGNKTLGLARREFEQATGTDIDMDPTGLPDQEKYIIAPEVKSFEIDFHNGTGWGQPTWDGAAPSFEGGPAVGPPAAVKITITLRRNLNTADDIDGDLDGATYTHIVAVPTANTFPQPSSSP